VCEQTKGALWQNGIYRYPAAESILSGRRSLRRFAYVLIQSGP